MKYAIVALTLYSEEDLWLSKYNKDPSNKTVLMPDKNGVVSSQSWKRETQIYIYIACLYI